MLKLKYSQEVNKNNGEITRVVTLPITLDTVNGMQGIHVVGVGAPTKKRSGNVDMELRVKTVSRPGTFMFMKVTATEYEDGSMRMWYSIRERGMNGFRWEGPSSPPVLSSSPRIVNRICMQQLGRVFEEDTRLLRKHREWAMFMRRNQRTLTAMYNAERKRREERYQNKVLDDASVEDILRAIEINIQEAASV